MDIFGIVFAIMKRRCEYIRLIRGLWKNFPHSGSDTDCSLCAGAFLQENLFWFPDEVPLKE